MKRVIIGALVGAVIYFGFQTTMWVGGFHKEFYTHAKQQDTILEVLKQNLPAGGMYMMPMADQHSPDFKTRQEELEKTMVGNPWAMVFYHPEMADFAASTLVLGIIYAFVAALIAAFVMYMGKFSSFCFRFTVSMLFALFGMLHGVFSYMNWWEFPWGFVQPQFLDLVIGWGLCSLWLAWFVKPREQAEPQIE